MRQVDFDLETTDWEVRPTTFVVQRRGKSRTPCREMAERSGTMEHWNYRRSRKAFRELAVQLGWQLNTIPVTPAGTEIDQLRGNNSTVAHPADRLSPWTIDVAISPVQSPQSALIVSSGLHGVEGLFGAGVQRDCMRRWLDSPPSPRCRIVLLHALNPHGFDQLRRVDAANRDLNRNFLLPGERYQGSHTTYRQLDPLLNPQAPVRRSDFFRLRAVLQIMRHGVRALQVAIASGQYDFPLGLFFGGQSRSELYEVLDERLTSWIGNASRVVHLDLHTGLGRWKSHQLLIDGRLTPCQQDFVQRRLPHSPVMEVDNAEIAYRARGSLGQWCRYRSGIDEYLYACVEFGTHDPLRVLSALRRENQLIHHTPAASDSLRKQVVGELVECFYPTSQQWRRDCQQQAAQLIELTLQGCLLQA